jgi:hypothetical protein
MSILMVLVLIHSFYTKGCCADTDDCHPVGCGEITTVSDGWQWQKIHFSKAMLRIAPDGGCHVCVDKYSNYPHCIYLPPLT